MFLAEISVCFSDTRSQDRPCVFPLMAQLLLVVTVTVNRQGWQQVTASSDHRKCLSVNLCFTSLSGWELLLVTAHKYGNPKQSDNSFSIFRPQLCIFFVVARFGFTLLLVITTKQLHRKYHTWISPVELFVIFCRTFWKSTNFIVNSGRCCE